jgi:CheY-like chemotaxis protein
MPHADGFEIFRRLRADPATRAVSMIAMSAGDRRRTALERG